MILSVKTRSRTEFIDITGEVQKLVKSSGVTEGLCMVFVPHTTAAVTINESADPSVLSDMLMVLNEMVPWDAEYRHLEGNSPDYTGALEAQQSIDDIRFVQSQFMGNRLIRTRGQGKIRLDPI